MSVNDLIDNEISRTARQPLKRGNPYDKPANLSFYDWLDQINSKPTKEELIDEKIRHNVQEELINS